MLLYSIPHLTISGYDHLMLAVTTIFSLLPCPQIYWSLRRTHFRTQPVVSSSWLRWYRSGTSITPTVIPSSRRGCDAALYCCCSYLKTLLSA